MDKETVALVLEKLDQLAQKMGTTAEQIWPWFVKQQYVEISVISIILAIYSTFTYIFFKKLRPLIKGNDERTINTVLVILFLCIIVLIWSLMFPMLFNPEFYAFKEILNMVK